MSHRLTLSLMSFLWTYLALIGLLNQYVENQPRDIVMEVSS